MVKESVTQQEICDLLNHLLVLDPKCMNGIMRHRQRCNSAIAEHATVQVRKHLNNSTTLGLVGILNGLFGVLP